MSQHPDGKAREHLLSEISDLREAINQLKALNDLALKISAAENSEEINRVLIRKALGITQAEQGVVTLIDRGETDLETVHRTRFDKQDDAVFQIDPVIIGWMDRYRKPIRIRPHQDPGELKVRWHPDINSFLCVPLMHKGTLIGLISLYNKIGTGGFTPEDERSLFIIAMQTAQSLENQRLRDKLFEATQNELSQTKESLNEAQQRLLHSEKMAALGQLTAGIAHEIKNPLNFINNFSNINNSLVEELAELLEKNKQPVADEDAEDLSSILSDLKANTSKINKHGIRIDGIVHSMIQHSKVATGKRLSTDLNALLSHSLNIVHDAYKKKGLGTEVQIVQEYDTNMAPLVVYGQEMGRVLVNLLENAFYAVLNREQPDSAPKIVLKTRQVNKFAEIHVIDNGMGISDKDLSSIFDPFFTTKPTGQGTGLGLSLSHDIVVNGHGGELTASSTEGEGSQFVIRLPLG
ncbi:MAG: GAF domain-containing protein [Rhodothermaceae bacterium]|nr:GAF domain-containing protein [Rhodothermaceae bacterium]